MTRYLNRILAGAAVCGALALSGSALTSTALAQPTAPLKRCFFAHEWQGWKAPNEHVMYIRVDMHHIYRLDFASSCQAATWADAHLVTTFHGDDQVCNPLDLDLKVSDGHGMVEPCIVSGISEMTPDEVAAIPKRDMP